MAQSGSSPTPAASQPDPNQSQPRFRLPVVIVTAEKSPEDAMEVPASVTTVQHEALEGAGVRYVIDAARFAPNVFIHEFTARKLSNPRFRGIGSSPNNPGVTTYLDGVPQLNANSSSVELLDVNQIEFVRGPQSSLFGRNAVGGVINVTSRAPSSAKWTGDLTAPFGTFANRDVRGSASGPLVKGRLAVSVAAGYSARDGFTTNDVTGHDLDHRSAGFSKVQLLWTPTGAWDTRLIVSTERARDGDYALQDLAALRARPFHSSRNFEGFTNRDIVAQTFLLTRRGAKVDFSSTTGVVSWKTLDSTDLDYSPYPLITRDNSEKDRQFTQEVRVASAANAPLRLSSNVTMKWQAGVSLFTQNYDQDAVNHFAPFLLSPQLPFAIDQHSPLSSLDDVGFGAWGRGTWKFHDKVDLSAGARVDREGKNADLKTFFSPAIAPPGAIAAHADFVHVSPQFSAAYRGSARTTIYGTVAQGFKAGGFNAASPSGRESYGEENSWNYEGGLKASWQDQRLSLNASVFHMDWRNLQVNLPDPRVPAQFFIANAGGAKSSGVELELAARPQRGLDVFGSLGYTHARFKSGSTSSGVPVGGNTLPDTPEYTLNLGTQYSHQVARASVYARGEVTVYGASVYDDFNTRSQNAYSLTDLRAGVLGGHVFGEAWVKNAFDTRYVPLAFAFGALAPSGFLGEAGAPRTAGVRLGVTF